MRRIKLWGSRVPRRLEKGESCPRALILEPRTSRNPQEIIEIRLIEGNQWDSFTNRRPPREGEV